LDEFGLTLKPIPLTDRAKRKAAETMRPEDVPDSVDGAVAVVVVLAEENSFSDAGAEVGHAAFKVALEKRSTVSCSRRVTPRHARTWK
jgi:hypothetical protein